MAADVRLKKTLSCIIILFWGFKNLLISMGKGTALMSCKALYMISGHQILLTGCSDVVELILCCCDIIDVSPMKHIMVDLSVRGYMINRDITAVWIATCFHINHRYVCKKMSSVFCNERLHSAWSLSSLLTWTYVWIEMWDQSEVDVRVCKILSQYICPKFSHINF